MAQAAERFISTQIGSMKKAEIIIVGGGVVGASVAYHLTQRGVSDVLILDREQRQGCGSTGRATGGVRAQFGTDINIRMSLYSIDFFENCGFYTGYDPRGYLFFATDEAQLGLLKANAARQNELGVTGLHLLDAKAVADLVPGLRCEDIAGAVFGERDGFIDPLAVMQGFTASAVDRGARLRLGTPVDSINVSGGRVRSVTAGGETVECSAVVLCGGAWAGTLAATAGIELPLEPVRRQIVWARTREPLPPNLPMVIDVGTGFHFRPAREFGGGPGVPQSAHDVLFAYPDAEERSSFNTEFDDGFTPKVYGHARRRAAFLAESEPVRDKCRAGLYENTPDHHAIIGKSPVEGLFLANGFSGHGVMHSPASGRAVAEIILDGGSKFIDVSCLSFDRFAEGKLIHENAFI